MSAFPSRPKRLPTLLFGFAFAAGCIAVDEVRSSRLQAHFLSKFGQDLKFVLEPGIGDPVAPSKFGPYDQRLGYSKLPNFTSRLLDHSFQVAEQARMPAQFASLGVAPIYREKDQAGLDIYDCRQQPMYSVRSPGRIYESFDSIPKVMVESLLFIEDRELLDNQYPTRNPAVNWTRFGRALLEQALHIFDKSHHALGASTLITQIEKYRHSVEGRTTSPWEKLVQMKSASIKAYMNGENTLSKRTQVVVEYLNTVPLAARRGVGEINGLGDGLWAWYGRDFAEVNALLKQAGGAALPADRGQLEHVARAYKQALSLIIAQRRPSYYLREENDALQNLTDSHLRVLASAGIIAPALRDAALAVKLRPIAKPTLRQDGTFVARKAVTALRTDISGLLRVPRLYDLDRLDLAVGTTLDNQLQTAVTKALRELNSEAGAKAAGLYGHNMLSPKDDPSRLTYSFSLFERGSDANLLRVQTDNLDQPFDINGGARLNLGSTAKLRTLITYLEIVAHLHQRYAALSPKELRQAQNSAHDELTRWALRHLAKAPDKSLRAMLEGAMLRKYSGSPGEAFFTGGGLQRFENFESEENARIMTVRYGFQHSVNLVFVRLMRDIVNYTIADAPGLNGAIGDPEARLALLNRFAEKEGREFLARFYKKYAGKSEQQGEALLVQALRANPRRLAVLYRNFEPGGSFEQFAAFVQKHLPHADASEDELRDWYEKFAYDKFSLSDRAYLTGVHPLELWMMGYLRHNRQATLGDALAASSGERQATYRWLFKTSNRHKQDKRIKQMLEIEAFQGIARDWRRLGYPFEALTPSYATALGASGDRPAALATLIGIIVNKGVKLPAKQLDTMHFARDTPYETRFVRNTEGGQRVLPEEIADVVRQSLRDVVQGGTGIRLRSGFGQTDGALLEVGGKTGTGDQRLESYASHGRLISSRAVNRTATFVFFLGERYFGTMTAHVREPYAADYRFTSALSVQLLRSLGPVLTPMMNRACREEAPPPMRKFTSLKMATSVQ